MKTKTHSTVTRSKAATHSMVNRSRTATQKPKVLFAAKKIAVPRTGKEALKDSGWYAAIKSEFDALVSSKTWTFVPPPGRKIID